MLYSMTGFGSCEKSDGTIQVLAQIKSVNGKGFEPNLRLSPLLRNAESEIRNRLSKHLVRGSIDCTVQYKQEGVARPLSINKELAASLYSEALQLANAQAAETHGLFATIIRLPEVISSTQESLEEDALTFVLGAVDEAIAALVAHRAEEGKALAKDLAQRIQAIMAYQDEVVPLAPLRLQRIRDKFSLSFDDFIKTEKLDSNRLEQEVVYYIEKIDFTEELTRLTEHCRYFLETLQNEEDSKGKKLGFILQEIGREINTLGSKAGDAAIQKIVVNMKDELEKAKEQVLNTL